jgi:hypothetical protein
MSAKPVYRAGQGFDDGEPPSRFRWLPGFLLLAALLLAGGLMLRPATREASPVAVAIDSDPPGARIWINLEDSGLRTPGQVKLDPDRTHLLQVRLPGFEASPLAWTLTPAELAERREALHFVLSPLPVPQPAEGTEAGQPAAAEGTPFPPAAELQAEPPTPPADPEPGSRGGQPRRQGERSPAAPSAGSAATEPILVRLLDWDPAFRLRVDGRERLPEGDAIGLEPGSHRIQIDAGGVSLLDTLLAGGGRLHLPGAAAFVEVLCQPAEARIVSGGTRLGQGRVLVPRRRLPLDLAFETLPGWLEPPPMRLDEEAPLRIRVTYREAFSLEWSLEASRGLRLTDQGYFLPDRGFVADRQRGPETRKGVLHLGRAHHDRRPGGAHELRFEFELPAEAHAGWPAQLEIVAGDSGDNFPLTLTDLATLTVLLNDVPIVQDIQLGRSVEARRWPVSSLLQPGANRLVLRSSERARSWTRLESVRIEARR